MYFEVHYSLEANNVLLLHDIYSITSVTLQITCCINHKAALYEINQSSLAVRLKTNKQTNEQTDTPKTYCTFNIQVHLLPETHFTNQNKKLK